MKASQVKVLVEHVADVPRSTPPPTKSHWMAPTQRHVTSGGVGEGVGAGMHCPGVGNPAPHSRASSLCPVTVPLTPSASSMAFVTDSNRPQPLWQPPPTACLTAAVAASEVPSLL